MPSPDPTPDEIDRVKRWECAVEKGGHDLEVVTEFGSMDPKGIHCTNCGQVWDIAKPKEEDT